MLDVDMASFDRSILDKNGMRCDSDSIGGIHANPVHVEHRTMAEALNDPRYLDMILARIKAATT